MKSEALLHIWKKRKKIYSRFYVSLLSLYLLIPMLTFGVDKFLLQEMVKEDIPLWMEEQIREELSSLEGGFDSDTIEKYYMEHGKNSLLRVKVRSGKLQFFFPEKREDVCRDITRGLSLLHDYLPLPDLDFLLFIDKRGMNERENPPLPIFTFGKKRGEKGYILFPDSRAISGFVGLKELVRKANQRFPWESKVDTIFWRGFLDIEDEIRSDRKSAFRLLEMGGKLPKVVDAKILCNDAKVHNEGLLDIDIFGKPISPLESIENKFFIHLEDDLFSPEIYYQALFSNSLSLQPLKEEIRWYDAGISPYKHYVPIKEDLSDLIEIYNWALQNDSLAESIAKNGNAFAKRWFSQEGVFLYTYTLLKEYSILQNWEKEYGNVWKKRSEDSPTQLGGARLPSCLLNIPYAESTGMVLGVKNIFIPGIDAPYNASILKGKGGYHLFFRTDLEELPPIQPFGGIIYSKRRIGYVYLDDHFTPISPYHFIDTKSDFSEDARAMDLGDNIGLIYNDISSLEKDLRNMHLAVLDKKNMQPHSIVELGVHWQKWEKNWTPFLYSKEGVKTSLYFTYYITPLRIFKLDEDKSGNLFHQPIPFEVAMKKLLWKEAWGEIRGGTPAIKISQNEYLAFFHSRLTDKAGIAWYLMGAYTFDAEPPFEVKKISPFPIFFKGIYSTPHRKNDSTFKRVVFPCGIALDDKEEPKKVHVSCGENDAGVKIITFDKEALMKSLRGI